VVVVSSLEHAEGSHRGVLVWRLGAPHAALSSAAVGGGRTTVSWVMNLGVVRDYARTDLAQHAGELATGLGLPGTGITLFTAADVTRRRRCVVGGVAVDATVGVTTPTWAADVAAATVSGGDPGHPGTINLVVQVPVVLDEGAAVNAVMTATEAKTQALLEHGIAGTGTASDAVVILWPTLAPGDPAAHGPNTPAEPADPAREHTSARFAGPRSAWGARLALAVHGAVRAGLASSR
jgi:adenosylcobinamide hydrolase